MRVQVAPGQGGGVHVRVIDQGPGIPLEEQGRLFQPYPQTSVRPTGGEKSTEHCRMGSGFEVWGELELFE